MRVEAGAASLKSSAGAGLRYRRNARNHQRQLSIVASVERQFRYLLLRHQRAYVAASCINRGRIGSDGYSLAHLSDLNIQVHDFTFGYVKVDVSNDCFLEPRRRRADGVLAWAQAIGDVKPSVVSLHYARAGLYSDFLNHDFGVGNRGSLLVSNCAANRSQGRRLGVHNEKPSGEKRDQHLQANLLQHTNLLRFTCSGDVGKIFCEKDAMAARPISVSTDHFALLGLYRLFRRKDCSTPCFSSA